MSFILLEVLLNCQKERLGLNLTPKKGKFVTCKLIGGRLGGGLLGEIGFVVGEVGPWCGL